MTTESLESLRRAALAALARVEASDWALGRVLSGDCRTELDDYVAAVREARQKFQQLESALLLEFIERKTK